VPNAERIAQDGDLELWQLQAPGPRAWVVGNTVSENDAALTDIDPTKTALVPPKSVSLQHAVTDPSQVSIAGRSSEKISVDVNVPAAALLVLSENYYPGWQATVDGQPTEIIRANLALRAVPVPAGQHHIEIWYDPLSFKLGALITLITLVACVGALIYYRGK
jgi:hypothetical protein